MTTRADVADLRPGDVVKILYVAGPMAGLPGFNLPAFAEATRVLKQAGYGVLNPGRHGADPDKTWQDYMRLGLADVIGADGIAVLPDWWESRGASLEVSTATGLHLPVRPVSQWLAIASSSCVVSA